MSQYNRDIKENAKRFYTLAHKLEQVLMHFSNSKYVVCNGTLNLSRNHPEYLGLWKPIIYKKVLSFDDELTLVFHLFRSFIYFFVNIFLEVFSFKKKSNLTRPSLGQVKYAFISHSLSKDYELNDPYFGNLINILSEKQDNVLRILIPHQKISKKALSIVPIHTHFLINRLKKFDIVSYFILTFYFLFQLIKYCLKNDFTIYEVMIIIVGQLDSFKLFKTVCEIENIIATQKPRNLVITFEGNVLEKAVFLLCSKYKVRSYAYQHAPIIEGQFSIFRDLNNNLVPDIILSSGPYLTSKFKSRLRSKSKIITLGSPKHDQMVLGGQSKQSESVLLIPDGNILSINLFVDLAIKMSLHNDSRLILIRSHPLVQNELESTLAKIKLWRYENVILSNSFLTEDLKISRWVIYQNSAVSIQAAQNGCQLIYFSDPLANINPLWEMDFLYREAKSHFDIEQIIAGEIRKTQEEVLYAQKIANLFFSPFNPKKFLEES
jgi:hypothetical protein